MIDDWKVQERLQEIISLLEAILDRLPAKASDDRCPAIHPAGLRCVLKVNHYPDTPHKFDL